MTAQTPEEVALQGNRSNTARAIRRRNRRLAAAGLPPIPPGLSPEEEKQFTDICEVLRQRAVLEKTDGPILELYSVVRARWHRQRRLVDADPGAAEGPLRETERQLLALEKVLTRFNQRERVVVPEVDKRREAFLNDITARIEEQKRKLGVN